MLVPIAERPVEIRPRPMWSVMIPTYNCAELLAAALPEVVDQLGGRDDVQIEVVDDGSADDPAAVVDRYEGIVSFHRNPVGLGAVPNFNNCVRRARGDLVHVLHGDDMVCQGFYETMQEALTDADHMAAFCRTEYIDDRGRPSGVVTRSERTGSGRWPEALEVLAVSNRVRPASVVVPRRSYEYVGGFREDLPHAADWEMWARLAASGSIWFVDEVLARYRVHDASDTSQRIRTGANIRERDEAIEVIAALVPDSQRSRLVRRATAYSSVFALRTAGRLLRAGKGRSAIAQVGAACRSAGRVARLTLRGR